MLRLLVFSLFPVLLGALSLPPGVPLKPAKQLDGSEDESFSSPPPNLSLRSRMMAAMNSDVQKSDRLPSLSQPLILKRKKLKTAGANKSKEIASETTTVTTARPTPTSTIKLPPSADYGVTSMLKTNFVDRKGKIHRDVISVPIRVGDGKKTVSASSALVEGESAKGVQVRFGPAPLRVRV